jgi:hypothetical protein
VKHTVCKVRKNKAAGRMLKTGFLNELEDEPNKRCGQQQRIEAIHKTAVARKHRSAIFYIRHAFNFAFQQIADSTNNL